MGCAHKLKNSFLRGLVATSLTTFYHKMNLFIFLQNESFFIFESILESILQYKGMIFSHNTFSSLIIIVDNTDSFIKFLFRAYVNINDVIEMNYQRFHNINM